MRHFLNQTSGIAGSEDRLLLVPSESETLMSQAKRGELLPLSTTPGTTMSYSNGNDILLGATLQEVSGMSYGEVIEKYIFITSKNGVWSHITRAWS